MLVIESGLDSGSCFDIVNTHEMRPGEKRKATKADRPYRMITAGGIVKADQETTVPLASTGSKATAIVMDDSPCVLSLGKRCMQEGFSFEWNAGENPVLVTPRGSRHTLELQNLVPVMPVVGRAELGGSQRIRRILDRQDPNRQTRRSGSLMIMR